MRHIKNDINDKAIGVKAEIEIKIEDWGIQWPKSLLYLITDLEFDKLNDQALDSLINFSFHIFTDLSFDLLLYMTSMHDFYLSDFIFEINRFPVVFT